MKLSFKCWWAPVNTFPWNWILKNMVRCTRKMPTLWFESCATRKIERPLSSWKGNINFLHLQVFHCIWNCHRLTWIINVLLFYKSNWKCVIFIMYTEYDDTPSDSTVRSPLELLKRSTSMHWTKNGQSSFSSMRRKLQRATSEFSNVTWL